MDIKNDVVREVLDLFVFPFEAEVDISTRLLRRAMFDVFDGRCYYTRRELTLDSMRIDHVVAKSLGGPDNIFNYVVVDHDYNSSKSGKFDPIAARAVLAALRLHHAPLVLEKLTELRAQKVSSAGRKPFYTNPPGKKTIYMERDLISRSEGLATKHFAGNFTRLANEAIERYCSLLERNGGPPL